jgi:hypothetical protein
VARRIFYTDSLYNFGFYDSVARVSKMVKFNHQEDSDG